MVVSSLVLALLAQSISPLADSDNALRDAIYQEVALGKTEQALSRYREIVEDPSAADEVKARSLSRIAVCLMKMGRPEEATEALRILRDCRPSVHRQRRPATGR